MKCLSEYRQNYILKDKQMVDERLNKRLQNINHRYQELFRSESM